MKYEINDQQMATILAALRYYQQNGQGDPMNRSDDIFDISTRGEEVISLDDAGIDDLCMELNVGEGTDVELSENEVAGLMLQRIEDGDLSVEDIPVRLARYGLMDPCDFIAEMVERMEVAPEV